MNWLPWSVSNISATSEAVRRSRLTLFANRREQCRHCRDAAHRL